MRDSGDSTSAITADATARRHTRTAVACLGVFALMLGASFAAVPLYRMFCQVTGYGGTTQRAVKPSENVLEREVVIRFDANVSRGLTWDFAPEVRTVKTRIGENTLAFYRATNTSDRQMTGTASFNVTPEIAGAYFNKIECFCFTEQTLKPGESIEMPLTFFVDPAIMQNAQAARIDHITLSYTFHPTEPTAPAAKGQAAVNGAQTTRSGS